MAAGVFAMAENGKKKTHKSNIKESDIQSQRPWLIFFSFYLLFTESGYKLSCRS